MNSSTNMRALILGAILAVVAADAPLPLGPYPGPYPAPYPAPTPVYGPPRIELPSAPYPPAIPAPVYGVPKVIVPPPQIITNYEYSLYTPKRVEVLAPYPAPVLKTGPYPAPVPIPLAPAPVYGPPRVEIIKPIAPIATSYNYDLPHYVPQIVKAYPAPAPVYGLPQVLPAPLPLPVPKQVVLGPYPPAIPHSEYGLQL